MAFEAGAGRLSDTDKTSFNLWLDYLDSLGSDTLDLSAVIDKASFEAIPWPEVPSDVA